MGKPVILALNMMDIVRERGMEIDMHRLPEMLGDIPVVQVSARQKMGLDVLLHAVKHHYEEGPKGHVVEYSQEIEGIIEKASIMIEANYGKNINGRWYAIKFMEYDEEVLRKYQINMSNIISRNYEKEIIAQKYKYIEEIMEETLLRKDEKMQSTDKVDKYLTHPVWGVPIFLVIMAVVFLLTFALGDFLKGWLEMGLEAFSEGVRNFLLAVHTSETLVSLVVDGIIAGVGGILTFLPNIAILFVALAILEDSGYMARVAYVMDSIMGKVGLSGKAFLPMVLGFGCTVPAIMATRALEKEEDRRRVMLITPFMSCSARLPIYVMFSNIFFGKYAPLVAFSMYVLGMVVALVIAWIVSRIGKKKTENELLIELPEYKSPNARTIGIYVWEKVKDYLSKAGTTIFIASIVIWVLLNFNIHGLTTDVSTSFGAALGKWMEPILRPAGLGMWQIAVALISGISAKEVVVSGFTVLFGVSNVSSPEGAGAIMQALSAYGFGPVNAYAMMVFCLLYTPCAATIGIIKKESGSVKFTIGVIVFQLALAWLAAVLVYQIGSLIF
jgi:ferrous iron transport protein B